MESGVRAQPQRTGSAMEKIRDGLRLSGKSGTDSDFRRNRSPSRVSALLRDEQAPAAADTVLDKAEEKAIEQQSEHDRDEHDAEDLRGVVELAAHVEQEAE